LKNIEVRICGLGGQGVVIAGQILGRAAIYSGKNAVQTQSYGAEARGSGAKSEVIISDGKIGFPVVRKCDILVAMSQEAVGKNVKDLKEDGVLLVDSSLVKEIPEVRVKILGIQATETAEKSFGQRLYANMIMLGALTKAARLVTQEAMEEAIRESVPERAADANVEAYRKGIELAASLY
jgi:2-oxoglutarate ferredoxin oxidoreductase subunit gamma